MKGIKRLIEAATGLGLLGGTDFKNLISSEHGGKDKVDYFTLIGKFLAFAMIVLGGFNVYYIITDNQEAIEKIEKIEEEINDKKEDIKEIKDLVEPSDSIK